MSAPIRLVRGGAIVLALWLVRAELLTAAALLGGWLLVTFGLAQLTTPKVWPLSIGVLLLLLCGWQWLWSLFSRGLYRLYLDEKEKEGGRRG